MSLHVKWKVTEMPTERSLNVNWKATEMFLPSSCWNVPEKLPKDVFQFLLKGLISSCDMNILLFTKPYVIFLSAIISDGLNFPRITANHSGSVTRSISKLMDASDKFTLRKLSISEFVDRVVCWSETVCICLLRVENISAVWRVPLSWM